MTGLEKIKQNQDQILGISLKKGVDHLRVFGSVVRNQNRPDSDVDFRVTLLPGHDLLNMIALSQDLEELLHQKTDVVSDEEVSPYLMDRVFQEAVAV